MSGPLDGWEFAQAIMLMVRAVIDKQGRKPDHVLIHPDDFADLRDWKGDRLPADATVYDVPFKIDEKCPRGKVAALYKKGYVQ